jgi:hypothetical protein
MSKELPKGWIVHSRIVNVSTDDLVSYSPKFGRELDRFTQSTSESGIAFNTVRKVRGPEAFPNKGYYTGFEGFFVAHCDEQKVIEVEREYGRKIEAKIRKLTHPLRKEVIAALEGTSYSLAAVSWLDAELGALIARLRCIGYQGEYNQQKILANKNFQSDTYRRIQALHGDQKQICTKGLEGETLIQYPLPVKAGETLSIPRSDEEVIMDSIGKFGLPLFRAMAHLF